MTNVDEFLDEPASKSVDAFLDEPEKKAQSVDAFLDEPESVDAPASSVPNAVLAASGGGGGMGVVPSFDTFYEKAVTGLLPSLHVPASKDFQQGSPAVAPSVLAASGGQGGMGGPFPGFGETASKIAGGASKFAGGLVDFASSPAGILGAAAPMLGLGRLAAGIFTGDMIRHQPEVARAFGDAVGRGDLEEGVASGLGLAANTILPGALGKAALKPRVKQAVEPGTVLTAEDLAALPEKESVISPELERALMEAERVAEAPVISTPEVETVLPKTETIAPKVEPVAAVPETKTIIAEPDVVKIVTPESEVAPKSKTETWADEVIAEAHGRFSSGVDPVLMTAYGVKGAHILGRGVKEIGEWSTEMVREYGEDIRPYLPEIRKQAEAMLAAGTLNQQQAPGPTPENPALGERQTPKQIDTLDYVSQEAKMRQGPRLYEKRSEVRDAAEVSRLIDEKGMDAAQRDFLDKGSQMPEGLRTALGIELQRRLAESEQVAALEMDTAKAREAVDKHINFLEDFTERGSEFGGGLQRYSVLTHGTPAANFGWAMRQVKKAAIKTMEGIKPGIDKIKETVREINEKVADEAAVATEKGLWTLEKESAIAKLVNEAKSAFGGRREKGPVEEFTIRLTKRLREVLKERLPKRSATVEKLTDAQILREAVTNPEKYAEVWKEAKDAIRKEFEGNEAALEAIDSALGGITPEPFSRRAIEGSIKTEMGAQGLEFRKLIREHYTKADAAGKSLAAKIVERVGVDEAQAGRLAAAVEKRFTELATERKKAALKQLIKNVPLKARGKVKEMHEKIVEMSNLGALDDAAFDAALAKKLGVPEWTREFAVKVKQAADDVQNAKEGFQRNRKAIDLMDLVENQKGITKMDVAMGVYYFNLLSAVPTHLVNWGATGLSAMDAVMSLAVRDKFRDIPGKTAAIVEGIGKGMREAAEVMQTGKSTGTRMMKVEPLRPSERWDFKGPAKFLNYLKYNYRLMLSSDLSIFKPLEEVKMRSLANRLAREEGLRGDALEIRTREIMGKTRERVAEAEQMAEAEGLTGRDRQRRIDEIIENQRPAEMRQTALEFALRTTFNEKPWGVLGKGAIKLNEFLQEYPIFRTITPFTHIVANVTNRSLDYHPVVGGVRIGLEKITGNMESQVSNKDLVAEKWARATVGVTVLSLVAAKAAQYLNDENPKFMPTGKGPRTPGQRQQLAETGWIPHSFKIGDDYYSYANTPWALPMATLGNYFDALRYKELGKTDLENRLAYASWASLSVISDQAYLSGAKDVFTMLSREPTASADETMMKRVTKTAANFAVPNMVRHIDRIFDPTVYDSKGIEANLTAAIPFVRRYNRPVLNMMGEPVEKYVSERFLKLGKPDPVWNAIAQKQAWISVPQRDTLVQSETSPNGKRPMTEDEYYEYVKTSGATIRRDLTEILPELKSATPDEAKKMVDQVVTSARAEAKDLINH